MSLTHSKSIALKLGYSLVSTEGAVAFVKSFGDEKSVVLVDPDKPERSMHYWTKGDSRDRYLCELDVSADVQRRAEELDSFELCAAYARDAGNQVAADRCLELRSRNLENA